VPRITQLAQTRRGIALAASFLRWHVMSAALIATLSIGTAAPVAAQNAATLMADQVFVDSAGRLIATGSVEVWQESVRLTATRVMFDDRRDFLSVEGPITITNGPDILFLADAAEISPDLQAGIISSARIVLGQQLQMSAASVVRDANGINQLTSVAASSCPVCASDPTPLWEIRAERVTHNENTDQLHFERAQFRFAGVPIMYLPRLRLPAPGLDRSRGVLRPEVAMDSDLGLSVGVPYFIPIGDAHDLTLTPTVSTEGMVALGFRWRTARQNGGFEFGGQVSRDQILLGELRGYAYMRALFEVSDGFRLSADLLAASDRTYLEAYDITDSSRLSADITLERVRRDQMIRARAMAFYSMRSGDVNEELPNTALQAELDQRIGLDHTPMGGELRFQLGAHGHERASSVDGIQGRDIARAHAQLSWRRSAVLAGGLVASGAVDGRIDQVRVYDDSTYPTPVTRRAAQAMVELRWPLAMVSQSGVRHVVEPVVQVIESRRDGGALPNDDNLMPELDEGNLFALARYSGEDAPDNGSRINAGLRWSRYDPLGWSTELAVGRIWRNATYQGYDPAHAQPLGGDASDWLLAGRLTHQDGYSASLRVLIDDNSVVSRAETNLAWSGPANSISTRYLYLPASGFENRATPLNEWSLDVTRQFGNGWSSSFGWEYDVSQRLFATARAGMEFRNECLSFDLSFARNFVTSTNPTASTRFSLSIELLGIGGRAPIVNGRQCRA